MIKFKIEPSWQKILGDEFFQDYMKTLCFFLQKEKQYTVYPCEEEIFAAFDLTPFYKVKVVILGQDPYHGEGQAHGLAFSVKKGIRVPPSLRNIYKELKSDLGYSISQNGNLINWAKQGVFLLNTILTVRKKKPKSHCNQGWEKFTDKVISKLNQKRKNIIFILWGSNAQSKIKLIDNKKHLVLKSVHPSPLSVYRGFFGCNHFSLVNNYLLKNGKRAINWKIVD